MLTAKNQFISSLKSEIISALAIWNKTTIRCICWYSVILDLLIREGNNICRDTPTHKCTV